MWNKVLGLVGALLLVIQGAADYYSKVKLTAELSQIRVELSKSTQELQVIKKQVKQVKTQIEKEFSEIMECDPIVN